MYMKKEESLIKYKENFLNKIINRVASIFSGFKKKPSVVNERTDFDILQEIKNNPEKIKDLDLETEKRLIHLCNMRSKQLDEKISKYDDEIIDLKILLSDLKKSF